MLQDTVTVIDTVRVAADGGSLQDWIGLGGAFGVAWGIVFTIGTLIFKVWSLKNKISDGAHGTRRAVRAGFENHLTEPTRCEDLTLWAQHARRGFTEIRDRFESLKALGAKVPGKVRRAVKDAAGDFDKASGIINRMLITPGVVENTPENEAQLRAAYQALRSCIANLTQAMRKEDQDRSDGYDQP